MTIRRLIAPLILAVVAILPAASAIGQAGPAMVIAARVVGDENRTRFIADITDDIDVAVFALADPYRIVIDLPEVHFQLDPGNGDEGRGLVSAYRFGLISRGMSRIVLDLTEPTRVDDFFVLPPVDGQPARLVVDLVPTTAQEFMVAAAAHRESFVPMPRPPVAPNPAGDGRLVVVIDPGHGGIDPGATGVNDTLEKDVVLAFSLELA